MSEPTWTDEQAAVLEHEENALLSASAGTGKTRTIVGKIAWRIGLDVGRREDGRPVRPCPDPCGLEGIAAITFTEKAACELKERLRATVEGADGRADLRWELDRAAVGTIHAFCARLLRDHALRLGIDPTFRVLDEREATLRLHEVIRERVLEAARRDAPGARRLLERFRLYDGTHRTGLIGVVERVVYDVRWHAERYEDWAAPRTVSTGPPPLARDRLCELAAELLGADPTEDDRAHLELAEDLHRLAHGAVADWLAWMERENVRDFDSLVLDARRLLTRPEHTSALASIRAGLRLLVIDEFQDTDAAQRDIAFALAGIGEAEPGPVPQLLLVGDPKQSIYAFRGADVAVWNDARATLCGEAAPFELTRNFRTQPGVIDFINRVAASAIEEAAGALAPIDPDLAIGYRPLRAHRRGGAGQGVEWLDCSSAGTTADRQDLEARLVVSRIRELLADGQVAAGPDEARPVRPRDIAVLARTRKALDPVDRGLREAGIPLYNAASLGMSDRLEVLDLVTLLRLLVDPEDDYHAVALLRSPFVGLRDEVIARIRLDPGARPGPLLRQATRYLARAAAGEVDWFGAPEHPGVADVEREALRRALDALAEAEALVDRVGAAELLDAVVERTGLRLHLLLRQGAEEAFAAMERFTALLDEYRDLPLAGFLELWDRWGEQDLGVPQAPLFSAADDVVTLQTIHTAKGLEWPIVFLLRASDAPWDRTTDSYLADPRLGPVLMPKQSERGPRSTAIADRARAADQAEEARLLYVALTRAGDRLVVSGADERTGYMAHLGPALEAAVPPHRLDPAGVAPARRPARRARAEDPVTRTGPQIEVFEAGEVDQFDLFHVRVDPPREPTAADGIVPVVYRTPAPLQASLRGGPISLDWLDGIVPGPPAPLAAPIETPPTRLVTSATELQLKAADPEAWARRYRHGVEEVWRFAPGTGEGGGSVVPPALRGTLIHGVLERIRSVEELSAVLDETIAGVDAPPDAEEQLRPGAAYREALEREIERVVTGERWRWYVEGEHHRELRFLVLAGDPPWRVGALDLYRPGDEPWIIDFKTHRIAAAAVTGVGREYEIQAELYRDAVTRLVDRTPGVILHFTHPDVAIEM